LNQAEPVTTSGFISPSNEKIALTMQKVLNQEITTPSFGSPKQKNGQRIGDSAST
jgi:hypothetical protein